VDSDSYREIPFQPPKARENAFWEAMPASPATRRERFLKGTEQSIPAEYEWTDHSLAISKRGAEALAGAGDQRATECVVGNELKSVGRDVVYPTRNPWFAGDVAELSGALVSLINTTERAVKATLCYSAGNLYSVPGNTAASAELTPVCSAAFDVQIPPFGAREFPVARDGSTHFSLKTQGAAIVLEMLRPVGASIKMYKVDSTIHFGGEVVGK